MADIPGELIAEVRSASREMVRQLGFLGRGLAGTALSPSAVHAIVELGEAGALTATDLAHRLLLEKSTISRLVQSLVLRGLLLETPNESDGRVKQLSLSPRGHTTWAEISRFANDRVAGALGTLAPEERTTVLRGLKAYAQALSVERERGAPILRRGYHPGLLGRIIAWHGDYYVGSGRLDEAFEAKVAAGVAEFATRLDRPGNGLWWIEASGQPVASIAIDGEDLGPGKAHLRWFFVTDGWRGRGLGDLLIQEAILFCNFNKFKDVHLWTLKGLDAAGRLYAKHGFVLSEEYQGNQWGKPTTERRFVRKI